MKREGVHVGTVAFLAARSVPKTTSGKVRRSSCRTRWIEGRLKPRFRDDDSAGPTHQPVHDPGPVRAAASTTEDVIHAAVCEVTRFEVDRDVPLADQVTLDSVEFVGLVTLIEQRLRVRLPATILNPHPSIA